MKKLDHNEAVKALREGKKVRAVGEGFIWKQIDLEEIKEQPELFIQAQYFRLEEEKDQIDPIEDLMANDFHNGWELWRLRDLQNLVKELDKRYVRK